MRKILLFIGIGVMVIGAIALVSGYFMKKHTKSFSPEEEVVFEDGDLKMKVFYNRPYKKGREIFGGLVPYGEVWRTGANEATMFQTTRPVQILGNRLTPGKYSLWTIPDSASWKVIWNTESGQWGINYKGEANRDPAKDVLTVQVPVIIQDKEIEQFTISFEKMAGEAEMVILWDKTVVAVPISY